MDWTRITNKFLIRKKWGRKIELTETKEIPLESMLQTYFTQMKTDLNSRLLCEENAGGRVEIFQPAEPVLWIESIIITGWERQPDKKKEKKGKPDSRWEKIKNRLLGRDRRKK